MRPQNQQPTAASSPSDPANTAQSAATREIKDIYDHAGVFEDLLQQRLRDGVPHDVERKLLSVLAGWRKKHPTSNERISQQKSAKGGNTVIQD